MNKNNTYSQRSKEKIQEQEKKPRSSRKDKEKQKTCYENNEERLQEQTRNKHKDL